MNKDHELALITLKSLLTWPLRQDFSLEDYGFYREHLRIAAWHARPGDSGWAPILMEVRMRVASRPARIVNEEAEKIREEIRRLYGMQQDLLGGN